jgi:predicted site-specific integrase-resolvase
VRQRQRELHGYSVHRLAKTLFRGRPTKVDVLKKWIDAGLLQAQQVGRARMVMPDEISRFHHTYCLRDEAARLLGISSNTLSSWVRAGRVLPAYPPRG